MLPTAPVLRVGWCDGGGATVGEAMGVVVRAVEVLMVARMAVVMKAAVMKAVVVRAAPSTCPNLRS